MLIGSGGSPLAKGGCLPLHGCPSQQWEGRGRTGRLTEREIGGKGIRELKRYDIAYTSHLVQLVIS